MIIFVLLSLYRPQVRNQFVSTPIASSTGTTTAVDGSAYLPPADPTKLSTVNNNAFFRWPIEYGNTDPQFYTPVLNWAYYIPISDNSNFVYFPKSLATPASPIAMYPTKSVFDASPCPSAPTSTTNSSCYPCVVSQTGELPVLYGPCKPTNLRNCAGDTGGNDGQLGTGAVGQNPTSFFWAVYGATGGYAVQRTDYTSQFSTSIPIWDPALSDVFVNAVTLDKSQPQGFARLYAVTGRPDVIDDSGNGAPTSNIGSAPPAPGWNSRSVMYGSYNPYDGATSTSYEWPATSRQSSYPYGKKTQTVRWFRLYDVGSGVQTQCSDSYSATSSYKYIDYGCAPLQPSFFRSVFRGVAMAPNNCFGACDADQ